MCELKKPNYFVQLLLIVFIVPATSCEKIMEVLPEQQGTCQIKRIQFFDGNSNYYGDFYYNASGNPDSVIFGFVHTGFPNLHFKYENGRLTQAKFIYLDRTYETWHKLGYTNGVITTDTVYVWGSEEEPEPLSYYSKSINRYEYDTSGRIIKLILDQVSPDQPANELTYSYNANGNLITGENMTYDNYFNIHGLHPIWQFFSQDFSVNNPMTAKTYNSFGLPLEFDNSSPDWQFPSHNFFGRNLNKSVIEYNCDHEEILTRHL